VFINYGCDVFGLSYWPSSGKTQVFFMHAALMSTYLSDVLHVRLKLKLKLNI